MQNNPARVRPSLWAQPFYLLKATRPRQWAKNLLIFLVFFFTIGSHGEGGLSGEIAMASRAALAVLLFSLLTGATYIINDLMDAEQDRQHPQKRNRPIASGRLTRSVALAGALALSVAGLALAFRLDMDFGWISALYLALNLAYSISLKHIVILDVLSISAGFVLRAVAGALVINVPISPWLFVMTSLGALMIALGKRRSELTAMGVASSSTRSVLDEYTVPLVDQLIAVVAPAAVVSYTLYTFTAATLPENHAMMLTVPFVVSGVFRYLFLVHKRDLGGEPEEIFLTDRPLIINNILWLATASSILLFF